MRFVKDKEVLLSIWNAYFYLEALKIQQEKYRNTEVVVMNKRLFDQYGIIAKRDLQAVQWLVDKRELIRVTKGTLEMRPMFHFTPKRIEAHGLYLLCGIQSLQGVGTYLEVKRHKFERKQDVEHSKNDFQRI
ncbi:MAG: hypothetical protein LBG15_10060 [Dysgonamonadaceae bacterium]|nr:hypothetical protein [Dysgonamonadaceae bacterium]